MAVAKRIAIYKELSKSGIVFLVGISVVGGYLIGQPAGVPLGPARMCLTLLGVLALASGSSALNQLQEVAIDRTMPRTSKRPLPSGRMTSLHAKIFILASLIFGAFLLSRLGVVLLWTGVSAVFLYNGLYTLWWKKHWAFAAVPGAVPGALPILMGYASSSGSLFAPGGIYLFALLFFWQMPHFWVLALKFRSDYQKGGIPTLPVAHGAGITVDHIVLWCLAYVGIALLAPFFLKVGFTYMVPAILISFWLIWTLFQFTRAPESKKWLQFFLWVNFSLIIYIGAAALDVWNYHLFAKWIIWWPPPFG
ncbi:MAG: protoheme IX farnesyltransferase [Bdellovibrionota bacterium]